MIERQKILNGIINDYLDCLTFKYSNKDSLTILIQFRINKKSGNIITF